MDDDEVGRLEQLLVCGSMPAIIKETIAFGVSHYGDELPRVLEERVNQVGFSINDVECSYRTEFHGVSEAVEIVNLYVEHDFSIISFSDFCSIVQSLCANKETDLGESIFSSSNIRSDYDVAKDYW